MSHNPLILTPEQIEEHTTRFQQLLRVSEIGIPEEYHPRNLCTIEDYARSGDIAASLEHSFSILHSYGESEKLSDDSFDKLINTFRTTATIPGFWRACESHGHFVATKSKSLRKGAIKDFVSEIGDEALNVKACYLLQSLALAHGDREEQSFILSENWELIGTLIRYNNKHCEEMSFFNVHFLKTLSDCVFTLKLCSVIPCNKSEIDEAAKKKNGRDISRSIWISHHLWLMDINTRTRYVESLTDKTEAKLRSEDKLWSEAKVCGIKTAKYQFIGEPIRGLFPLPI